MNFKLVFSVVGFLTVLEVIFKLPKSLTLILLIIFVPHFMIFELSLSIKESVTSKAFVFSLLKMYLYVFFKIRLV